MGKPTSCFSIITCGGDLKDHGGDIDVSENKATSEKRGWSFRKRSTRQRVLSDSIIAEAPPSEYKDSFEATGLDSKQTATLKIVTDCINEKPQLSCSENAKTIEVKDNDGDLVEESIAIVIQTAIRGLLAQMALTKLKSVVKLQAAVRGHIVRRHAVGTLRCIQAIVKIQVLVRGHSSLQSDPKNEPDLNRSKIREDKEFDKSKVMAVSIEKLLNNKFAKLLLDSTPRTTSINIKCDPLKSDSAWKWLERWMSVSSVDTVEQNKAEIILEKAGIDLEKKLPSPTEGEAGLISCEDQSAEVQACEATSRETKDASMEAETGQSSSSREMEEAKGTSMEAETDESSREPTVLSTKELDSSENFSLPGSREILAGGSEHGTELSITSTLDSPDRCDSVTFELEHDRNVLVEHIPDSNRSKTTDIGEVDVTPVISSSNMSQPTLNDPKKSDLAICESIISGDSETCNQACILSPEASPKSHVTVLESQGTPSSQQSVKANKNKASNSGSTNKKSHFNNTHNSAKDQKNGKRRNSSGSARPDDVELESRDSTSNNSLPHFMQATESARAKLNSNNSPKSSPDIQDRDINGKKRRSLSGSNGGQGSPRIQRSMSQAQQTAKGNESKWKR